MFSRDQFCVVYFQYFASLRRGFLSTHSRCNMCYLSRVLWNLPTGLPMMSVVSKMPRKMAIFLLPQVADSLPQFRVCLAVDEQRASDICRWYALANILRPCTYRRRDADSAMTWSYFASTFAISDEIPAFTLYFHRATRFCQHFASYTRIILRDSRAAFTTRFVL